MQLVIRPERFKIGVVKILTILLLAGCTGTKYRAPVDSLEQPPSQKITAHIVAKGETLYSIAWRYNQDVHALAQWNRILQPYTIYPGQRIDLDPSSRPPAQPFSAPAKADPSRERSISRSVPALVAKPAPAPKSKLTWQWPVSGAILTGFSGARALDKGIDIGAEKGEPVVAAGSGTVVYAGDGLRGYGNLLIIKHNESYLSAYAHNDKLLVAEGESVQAGQQIAEVGSSGTNRNKLHFEIRRDGKPVDPMGYLPRQ